MAAKKKAGTSKPAATASKSRRTKATGDAAAYSMRVQLLTVVFTILSIVFAVLAFVQY